MAINFQQLLLHDVQTVFDSLGSDDAESTLSTLKDMADKIFRPFNLGHNQDLWIKDKWATGPQYGYKGFPDHEMGFPPPNNPQIVPLPITLRKVGCRRHFIIFSRVGMGIGIAPIAAAAIKFCRMARIRARSIEYFGKYPDWITMVLSARPAMLKLRVP
jgi:hypothetical protein